MKSGETREGLRLGEQGGMEGIARLFGSRRAPRYDGTTMADSVGAEGGSRKMHTGFLHISLCKKTHFLSRGCCVF